MNYDGFIREEISVDVSLPNYFTPPLIKEGDRGTRGFKVTITDGGEPIEIPDEGTEIWFNCRNRSNPEKHGSNRGVVNADGTVNVDVPAVVMDVPGMVECDISIITSVQGSDEPSILKTTLFCLNCEAAANKNGTTTVAEDNILAKIVAGEINPPGGTNYEYVVEVVGDDLDHADRNDTLYIHKVGNRVKGIVFVAGDVPPYQGCTQYRLRKSGAVEYRTGTLNTTTDPYSYDWSYTATGNWKRLATLDDIPDIPEVVNPWKNKTYISHGDSITWQDGRAYGSGTHQGETARGYQTVLKELLELGTHTNKGVNGATLADRAGVSVSGVSTIKSIASYASYDLCTIAFGTNDFKQGVPLGTLGAATDTVFDTTTFFGAFREAVKYILTSSPTIRLVLMTPLQRDQHDYNVDTVNAVGLKLSDYVDAVKLIGKMYGLPVCDLYSNSGITKLTLSTYTIDGLHPNDEGFKRIGEVLADTLTSGGNNDAADLSSYAKLSDIPDVTGKADKATTLAGYGIANAYTKGEVNSLIGAISALDFRVVQSLPTTDISTSTIYLVPKSTSQTRNVYDEYLYVNNSWEQIGSTEVDLSDYVKEEDVYTTDEADNTFMKFAPEMNPTNADRVHVGQLFKYSGLLYFKYGTGANDYFEVSKKSDIPSVPTKVSAFENDAGYLTLGTLPVYNGGVQ